jgi:peroxiredoxin Q/BCP
MVKVGDKIPYFILRDQHDDPLAIEELIGKNNLVIYFYPKDETAGCTAEACSFRDQYEDFTALGSEVIGISADSPDSHRKFAANHRLPFRLLSDPGNKVRKLFGVPGTFLGIIPGRVTYIVDRSGTVRHIFNSQFQTRKHVEESMRIIQALDAS